MSSSLRLNPGNVYFLRLQDQETGDHHPFVKIGITHGPVADRIRQLKTGSPYSIVEYTSFASEAAHHVEQMMHRRLQPRRRNLEWFRIDEAERQQYITWIEEAVAQGARKNLACETAGLNIRTVQLWCRNSTVVDDKRPDAFRPAPANKLTAEEKARIIVTCNQSEFANLSPNQIIPVLTD